MRRRTWIWTHLRESSKSSVRGRESAAVRLTRDGEKQASVSCFSLHTRARLNNNPLNTGAEAGAERLVVPTGRNRDAAGRKQGAAGDGGAARQLGRGGGGGPVTDLASMRASQGSDCLSARARWPEERRIGPWRGGLATERKAAG